MNPLSITTSCFRLDKSYMKFIPTNPPIRSRFCYSFSDAYCIFHVASLGDWWSGYGYEIPTLQRAAVRILSQPCSSYGCSGWNWSTFETLHSKKHSRAEQEKLTDLVFVQCNLWLQHVCLTRDSKYKPVVFDDVDVSLEWPSELECSAHVLDDSWLDNLPLEGRGSP